MKVKEALDNIIKEADGFAAEILKDLVERNTPKKPLLIETSAENKHHYICSSCNTIVNIGNSIGYNKVFNVFCKKCGQRLKWRS